MTRVLLLLSVLLLLPAPADAGRRVIEGLPFADPMPTGQSNLAARLFFTGNQLGEFEPCACPDAPLGGIAQQVGAIDAARGDVPVFWFDGGDRFFRQDGAMSSVEEAVRRRGAILLADAGSVGGLDAHGVGRLDLGAGLDYFQKLARRGNVPVISANLVGPEGGLLFPASTLVTRGGVAVGVTSVLPADTSGRGFAATDPIRAARDAVKALRDQGAELVVVLSNLSGDDDARLLRGSRADVLFGTRSREIHESGPTVGRSVVARAGSRGRYLGDVRWYREGRGQGPHLIATVTPVPSDGAVHTATARLVEGTLRALADPELGVEPFRGTDPDFPGLP